MLTVKTQQGFTLIEVMVTVFVVAVGLLGAAALQALSKKAAVDAVQRTTASVLAQDMLERIRSNSQQAVNYQGEIKSRPAAGTACGVSTAKCTDAQLVGYDIARWWDGLDGASETITENGSSASAGGLRDPIGCIRVTGSIVEVVIAWRGLSAISQGNSADLEDPTNDTCGLGDSKYAAPDASGGQSYRRVLRLQAHVQDVTT